MANPKVLELTDGNFEQEIGDSDTPILVDFWATWCAPCQRMSPMLDELADAYDGKVRIGKVNADENRELVDKFNVQGLPTFIFFEGGEAKDRLIGAQPKGQFLKLFEPYNS